MKNPIVILHGWGISMSGDRYREIKKIFEKKGYKVFSPDLPGFGGNKLNKEELFFEDYVGFIKEFLEKNALHKVILIGHSFGGRIAIRFTALYPKFVEKLVLTGASGIPRPLQSFKKKAVYVATEIIKPVFIVPPFSWFYSSFRKLVYYSIGEMDYYKAGSLTKTFRNVYKINIGNDLDRIKVPTLIIWGENDAVTPLDDGLFMHKHITKSQIVVIPGASHKLPYEYPEIFAEKVYSFLESTIC